MENLWARCTCKKRKEKKRKNRRGKGNKGKGKKRKGKKKKEKNRNKRKGKKRKGHKRRGKKHDLRSSELFWGGAIIQYPSIVSGGGGRGVPGTLH